MKLFLVFKGDKYYPLGGWGDFSESFGDIESARERANDSENMTYP